MPDAVRPTSDRVRESIFDILASSVDLDGMRVADLFAGTGALGIEALSRGAGSVTFVERDPDAAKSIKANLNHTGLDLADATIVRRDVLDFLSAMPPGEPAFDLVLCDPPYSFERWNELMDVLPDCLCVLESGTELEVADRWMVLRTRRYGGTLVTVLRPKEEVARDDVTRDDVTGDDVTGAKGWTGPQG